VIKEIRSVRSFVEIHYRHVPSEHIAEFEDKEMRIWSKVKQNAIDNGDMLATAFFRIADAGVVEDETIPTHAFVLVYKDFKQLANSSNICSSDIGDSPTFNAALQSLDDMLYFVG
jgi:hypothetical protein